MRILKRSKIKRLIRQQRKPKNHIIEINLDMIPFNVSDWKDHLHLFYSKGVLFANSNSFARKRTIKPRIL